MEWKEEVLDGELGGEGERGTHCRGVALDLVIIEIIGGSVLKGEWRRGVGIEVWRVVGGPSGSYDGPSPVYSHPGGGPPGRDQTALGAIYCIRGNLI